MECHTQDVSMILGQVEIVVNFKSFGAQLIYNLLRKDRLLKTNFASRNFCLAKNVNITDKLIFNSMLKHPAKKEEKKAQLGVLYNSST